jgi:hypothetical protein
MIDRLTAIALLLRETAWEMERVSSGDYYVRLPESHLREVYRACGEFQNEFRRLMEVEHG